MKKERTIFLRRLKRKQVRRFERKTHAVIAKFAFENYITKFSKEKKASEDAVKVYTKKEFVFPKLHGLGRYIYIELYVEKKRISSHDVWSNVMLSFLFFVFLKT